MDTLTSAIDRAKLLLQSARLWYSKQSPGVRVLAAVGAVLAACLVVVVVLFHAYLIKLLINLADAWKQLLYGAYLLFTLVFFVGFPPMLGFSALSMLSGMVYGLVKGWLLLAAASVTGSFASFLVFRYLLKERSKALLNSNEVFRAFADTLKQEQSLLLLILIRLCPLPYSLSNGALAAVPELSPLVYFLASVITSPKLFAHIFVGHQLKDIGDDGNTTAKRIIDVVTIVITGIASATTTYVIYHKMQRRLERYHNNGYTQQDVFGDFGDDESNGNLELDSADYDPDYHPEDFVIEEEFEPVKSDSESRKSAGDSRKSVGEAGNSKPTQGDKIGDINDPLNTLSSQPYMESPVKPGYRDY